METEADDQIARFVSAYDQSRKTQVLVIEGDQGTGKTNLLNYYEREFNDLYPKTEGFYIIRYYSDPEPTFDKMLVRILQELGSGDFMENLAHRFAEVDQHKQNAVVETARLSDMRTVLRGLGTAAHRSEDELKEAANAALEWILGFRVLNRHRESLGPIHFRLDTVESKTQALRDLVFCGAELDVLKGLIILLDELEKQDDTKSKMTVLRFLSAIRALIDALPQYLFLMAAMTPEARRRYFSMLPAFAGRLQNKIEIPYLKDEEIALRLFHFYLDDAGRRAESKLLLSKPPDNVRLVVSETKARAAFTQLLLSARKRGDEGVRQRDFLNELHKMAEETLTNV
ncbi:MAG: hypothetical protein HY788_20625 [Deltaproteobacteria bacterium]|nr:hypothetical protein [Deltaproteobacteria bacterium]